MRTVVIPATTIVYLTTTTIHRVVVGHLNIYCTFGKYIYQNSRPRIIHPLVAAAVGLTLLPSVRTLRPVFAAITQLQRNQTDVKAVQICFQFAIKFLYRVFFARMTVLS